MSEEVGGLRYNKGKNRHDLLPAFALNEVAKVFTKGAEKYEDNNWRKGMKWSTVLASLKRHLNYIENGVDFDDETNLLHAAHLATNAIFLLEYYKIAPQFDDRKHDYLKQPKIGLDIDEVLADFLGAWCKHFNHDIPDNWNFSFKFKKDFESLNENDKKEFYLNLQPKIKATDIPFEPHCYITSRSIPQEWTEEWLQKNGFPTVPVYTIPHNTSKVEVAKASGIDWFIDDRFENFVELNKAGICTFLFDCKHNQRYNVGYKRIKDFKDFKERFL